MMYYGITKTENYICHHGVKGQKWGVRHDPERSGKAPSKKKSKVKTILKVGAGIVAGALLAYGAYKVVSSVVNKNKGLGESIIKKDAIRNKMKNMKVKNVHANFNSDPDFNYYIHNKKFGTTFSRYTNNRIKSETHGLSLEEKAKEYLLTRAIMEQDRAKKMMISNPSYTKKRWNSPVYSKMTEEQKDKAIYDLTAQVLPRKDELFKRWKARKK